MDATIEIKQIKESPQEKSKYKSFSEWRKACPNAYAAARRRGMFVMIAERFGWELPKTRISSKTKYIKIKMKDLAENERKLIWKIENRKYLSKKDMVIFCDLYNRGYDFRGLPEIYKK